MVEVLGNSVTAIFLRKWRHPISNGSQSFMDRSKLPSWTAIDGNLFFSIAYQETKASSIRGNCLIWSFYIADGSITGLLSSKWTEQETSLIGVNKGYASITLPYLMWLTMLPFKDSICIGFFKISDVNSIFLHKQPAS